MKEAYYFSWTFGKKHANLPRFLYPTSYRHQIEISAEFSRHMMESGGIKGRTESIDVNFFSSSNVKSLDVTRHGSTQTEYLYFSKIWNARPQMSANGLRDLNFARAKNGFPWPCGE